MNNNKGFSLVEMIVSVAIMTIIMAIATSMLSNGSSFFEKQAANIELQNSAQIVNGYLTESIQEASGLRFYQLNEDDGTGAYHLKGVYELYACDESMADDGTPSATFGAPTGKGTQRILYYDEKNHSLYMVSFEVDPSAPATVADVPGSYVAKSASTGVIPAEFASKGFLISDEVYDFKISFNTGAVTDPMESTATAGTLADGSSAPTAAPEIVVRNPVTIHIEYTIKNFTASSSFEVDAICRNHLDSAEYMPDSASGVTVYRALDR